MSAGVPPILQSAVAAAVSIAWVSEAVAQESVTVEMTTTVTGDDAAPGYFAPFNLWAVWIEDAAGNFVKTIGRNDSAAYMQHMVTWTAASGGRAVDTDAVSGATRADHGGPLSLTWDMTDRAGQVVPDGVYTIRMELADENTAGTGGLPEHNNQGSFTIDKNGVGSMTGPLSDGGFNDVEITYVAPDAALCGNGAIDPGETCDGDCETRCADTGDACMPAELTGDAARCTAMCAVVPVAECIDGDGCCAPGCSESGDDDCVGANANGGCQTGGGAGSGWMLALIGLLWAGRRRRRSCSDGNDSAETSRRETSHGTE